MATIKKTISKKPASKMKKGGTVKKAAFGEDLPGKGKKGSTKCPKGGNCGGGGYTGGRNISDKEYQKNLKEGESNLFKKKYGIWGSGEYQKDNVRDLAIRSTPTISEDEEGNKKKKSMLGVPDDEAKYGKKVKKTMKTGGMVKKSAKKPTPKKAPIKKAIIKKSVKKSITKKKK
jgi:hypothetical protein